MVRSLLAGVGLLSIIAVGAVSVEAYDRYDDGEVNRLRVPTTGLDLTTRDGQLLLNARIDTAVRKLCDYRGDGSVLSSYSLERKCRTHAYASTRVQVASAIDAAWTTKRYAMRQRRRWAPGYAEAPAYAAQSGYVCRDGSGRRMGCDNAYAAPRDEYAEAAPQPFHGEPAPAYGEPERYAEAPRYPAPRYGDAPYPRPDVPPVDREGDRFDRLEAGLSRLSSDVRDAVERSTTLAFRRGDAAQWRAWNERGYVTVSEPRWREGSACRNVLVVRAVLGGYETLATGLRCWNPREGFVSDWG